MQNNISKDQTPIQMYTDDILESIEDDDFVRLYNVWNMVGEPPITDNIINIEKQKFSLLSLMNKHESHQCLEGFHLITGNSSIISDINTDVDIKEKTDISVLENIVTNAIVAHNNIALRKIISKIKYEDYRDVIIWAIEMNGIANLCGNEVSKNIINTLLPTSQKLEVVIEDELCIKEICDKIEHINNIPKDTPVSPSSPSTQ